MTRVRAVLPCVGAALLVIVLLTSTLALFGTHDGSGTLVQPPPLPPSPIVQQPAIRKLAIAFESGPSAQTTRDVMRVFMDVLGKDWRFQLFVTDGARYVFEIDPVINAAITAGRVELTVVPRFNRTTYMRWQLDTSFWERVHGDWVLLFHADSIPCRRSPHRAEDWLGVYDYLGAPWVAPNRVSWADDKGGNSGLSLRNRTAMLKLLRDRADDVNVWLQRHPDGWGEDVFIGRYGSQAGMRIAPQEIEMTFSVEMKFYPEPFGIHKPWSYLRNRAETRQLFQSCPDAKIIAPTYLLWFAADIPTDSFTLGPLT